MSDEAIEADFIEFEFGDMETATLAEPAFPINFVSLGTAIAIRSGTVDDMGDQIRTKLKELGLEWTESASSLTEEDMWPTWPEGDDEDEDDEPEASGPSL